MNDSEMDILVNSLKEKAKEICRDSGLDTVQIIATFVDQDETTKLGCGGHGNVYARIESARWFVRKNETEDRPSDGDGE